MASQKIKSLFRRSHDGERPQSSSGDQSTPSPRYSTAGSNQSSPVQQQIRAQNTARAPAPNASQSQQQSAAGGIRVVHPTSEEDPTTSPFHTRATNKPLPPINPQDDLSSDLGHMSLAGDDRQRSNPSSQRYSEDIARRNHGAAALNGAHTDIEGRRGQDIKTNRGVLASNTNEYEGHGRSVSDMDGYQAPQRDRREVGTERDNLGQSPTSQSSRRRSSTLRRKPVGSGVEPTESQSGLARTMEQRAADGQAEPPSLEGVVDLTNTVDTDVREQYAPAVIHETVLPHVHTVREEQIHREIHNHTYLHRVQPVLDFEVLPARHFIPNPSGEGIIEVTEDQLPDCTGKNQKWVISEKRATTLYNGQHGNGARPLVGLDLDGHDEKRSIAPAGFERIETTWVHPPTLEDTSKLSGPTYPVHFGECDEGCAREQTGHVNGHAERHSMRDGDGAGVRQEDFKGNDGDVGSSQW